MLCSSISATKRGDVRANNSVIEEQASALYEKVQLGLTQTPPPRIEAQCRQIARYGVRNQWQEETILRAMQLLLRYCGLAENPARLKLKIVQKVREFFALLCADLMAAGTIPDFPGMQKGWYRQPARPGERLTLEEWAANKAKTP